MQFLRVQLKIPVQFGEKLLPIGIPGNEDYNLDDGTMCFVTGWKYNMVSVVSNVVDTGNPRSRFKYS